jgi:maltose O-acetyltransferase
MSAAGVPPFTDQQLRHRHGAAVGALPDDGRAALRWLRRGHLVTSPLLPLALRRALLRLGGVKLGAMIWGLDRCWFESPLVSIGTGSAVNSQCYFEGYGPIEIGRNCMIGPQVTILTSIHEIGPGGDVARESQPRKVTIGDGCWLGTRAMIMPGVSIGAGVVVAAGAVVTKDCEPGGLYGGVPARRIR